MPTTDWPPPQNLLAATWPVAQAAAQGWECPKCGHVYAPSVASCWHCPQQPVSTTATGAVSPCTCGTSAVCQAHKPPVTGITCSAPGGGQ